MNQWLSAVAMFAVTGYGLAPLTLAQAPAKLPKAEGSAVTWGVAVALVLIVCITAFINPKRSHHA